MLEASLPGPWSLRSQSVLLVMTDAHNFAEGVAGLCMPQLAVYSHLSCSYESAYIACRALSDSEAQRYLSVSGFP